VIFVQGVSQWEGGRAVRKFFSQLSITCSPSGQSCSLVRAGSDVTGLVTKWSVQTGAADGTNAGRTDTYRYF
jgi:hypothetical protein